MTTKRSPAAPPFVVITAAQKSAGKTHLMLTVADLMAINGFAFSAFQVDDQKRLSEMLGEKVIDLRPDPDRLIEDPTLMTRALTPFYEACRRAIPSKTSVLLDCGANETEAVANFLRDVDLDEDVVAWKLPVIVLCPFYPEAECLRQTAYSVSRIGNAVQSARIVLVENRFGGSVERITPGSITHQAYRELLSVAKEAVRIVMPAIAKEYWAPYEGAGLRLIKAIAMDPESASRALKKEIGEVKVMRAQIARYIRTMHAQLSQIIDLPRGGQ
ncbi:hypothetical protein [Bradyrhizobium diazoefficiens]|uniref:hypothetical protein n=1 Tax=Bradyrhizobium diazoefficiens TaxID=1355477 RepID=UPI003594B2C3